MSVIVCMLMLSMYFVYACLVCILFMHVWYVFCLCMFGMYFVYACLVEFSI